MNAEKFWDAAAEKYAKSAIGNEAVYQAKLKLTRDYFTSSSNVLELGCGTGSTAIAHAPFVNHFLATDISNNMLDVGRRRASEAGVENVTFEQTTVEKLQAPAASFDAVLALNILHLIDDPAATIHRVASFLKPGGIFVSSTVCLGDVVLNYYRLLIPIMRLLGKAPPVHYVKRSDLEGYFENSGFEIVSGRPPVKGEAAFIIAKKAPYQ
jgi:ubiquinone/menaquinone biosynthesis C-methylase UbiE